MLLSRLRGEVSQHLAMQLLATVHLRPLQVVLVRLKLGLNLAAQHLQPRHARQLRHHLLLQCLTQLSPPLP